MKCLTCCIVGAACIAVASEVSADENARLAAIQEALNNGAVIVECKTGTCRNIETNKIVEQGGDAPDGAYVVYPNDTQHSEDVKHTQAALQASQ